MRAVVKPKKRLEMEMEEVEEVEEEVNPIEKTFLLCVQ